MSSIIAVCSFGTFMKALSLSPLSLLYTIHAHYILIPIIFSVFYYKEHIDRKKVFAVFLSMIAIAFLI
jgi:drug/metabolite transporter (DMT)-like permease